jgi:plasmid stabilization system protein ParE
MANRPLEFHPEAEKEYLTALAWYRERSLVAARNFENAVGQAASRISENPDRWPEYFDHFKKYTLRQFPFSLVYRTLPTHILVLAVAHGRRRPGFWRDRI